MMAGMASLTIPQQLVYRKSSASLRPRSTVVAVDTVARGVKGAGLPTLADI